MSSRKASKEAKKKLDFLKNIDLFGRPVNLRFNDSDKFQTHCGGCATLLMGLTITTIFLVNLSDIIRGKVDTVNYTVNNSAYHKEKNDIRNKEAEKFQHVLAVGLHKDLWDPQILKI